MIINLKFEKQQQTIMVICITITKLSFQSEESYVTKPASFVEYRLRLFKKSKSKEETEQEDKEADEKADAEAIKWLDDICVFD